MSSIGDTLSRERLRRGLNLEQVAAETKIGLHLLEAMEANQFDRLPGAVFTRSFVRQYAQMLELDEEEMIAALKQQFEEPAELVPPPEPPHSSLHVPPLEDLRERFRSDSSLSAFVWVVLAVVACAGVFSFWQRGKYNERPAEPAAISHRSARQVSETARLQRKAPIAPVETPKPDFRPAEVSDTGTISAPPATIPQPAPPASSEPATRQEGFPVAMRVAFTATEPVWVSIKSDGARAYTGVLEGQQSRQFDASRKMTVLVGNAGGLQISLNGKSVGPVGSRGEIQLLQLTPDGVHVVPRTPPTPPPTSGEPTAPADDGERP